MHIKYIRLILPFMFCFFLTVSLIAQNGTISGYVTGKNSGEAAIAVNILLFRLDDNASRPCRRAQANRYGYYTMTGLQHGQYIIKVSGVGFSPYEHKFELDKIENLKLNIQLDVIAHQTREITVEGEREINQPRQVSTVELSPSFISRLPSLGGESDVFRALYLMPGIKQATEISSGLYVRGSSPDQNLVLIDGVTIFNPGHVGGLLSTFNSDMLKDVRLIKGAFPAEYGSRTSSVLDLTMRDGTKEKLSGSYGLSTVAARLTMEGPVTDKSTFMLSGRRLYLDLIQPLFPEEYEIPGYYFYDLNGKYSYEISENDKVFVSGFLGRDVLSSPKSFRRWDYSYDISWGNTLGSINWTHVASPELFTTISLNYTGYSFSSYNKYDTTFFLKTNSRIGDIYLKASAQYNPRQDHIIKSGLDIIYHKFDTEIQDTYSQDTNYIGFAGQRFLYTKSSETASVETAFFIQDEWKAGENLTSNIGARCNYFSRGNYFNFEPRISASYKLTEDIIVNTAFAVANQYLHLIIKNDISLPTDVWFPSSPAIKPERTYQGVLGINSALFDNHYYFSFETYYKSMSNLYEYREDNDYYYIGQPLESSFTSGRGEAYGFEFFLNKRIGRLTGWAGYTLSWTKRYFSQLNNGKPFYPRYDSRHDVSLVLTYNLNDRWEFAATWYYSSGQAYTMPVGTTSFNKDLGEKDGQLFSDDYINSYSGRNAYRLPAYHRLDLNVMYKFEWFDMPFSLSLNIYNVYNRHNILSYYYNYDRLYNSDGSGYQIGKRHLNSISLFPLIPSLGLSAKF